jgi:hypothetical protein
MKRNQLAGLSGNAVWRLLCEAAKRAMEAGGYELARVPGRGLSNLWLFERNGKRGSASIRTTRDRWFAFPPLNKGTKWKTLDDVDVVLVAAVDDPDNPEKVEVYIFDADAVRKRFRAAYDARIAAGHRVKDNFGMWLKLDRDERGLPTSVGSGLADQRPPVATYAIADLMAVEGSAVAVPSPIVPRVSGQEPAPARTGAETISNIMAAARERVAELAGVRIEAVKLDVRIEY